jgi:hypothetical protein
MGNPALKAYKDSKKSVKRTKDGLVPPIPEEVESCKSCGFAPVQEVILADKKEAHYCLNCRVTMPRKAE